MNLGIPGSSPRVWSLLLDRVDPDRDRFEVVVVPLGEFVGGGSDDQDPADRLEDLSFMGPILGLGQAQLLASSYPGLSGRREAWLGSAFKVFAYRHDIRAGFADPLTRTVGRWRLMHGYEASSSYKGRPENMTGVRVEGRRVVGFPPVIPAYRRQALEKYLFSAMSPEHEAARDQYRKQWLGRICERYVGSATKVVIVRLPPTVLPRPSGVPKSLGPVLSELDKLAHVHVVPVERTADLQAAQFYCDTTHLNRPGRTLWTRRVAQFVAALLK